MRLINRPCTIIHVEEDPTGWDEYGDEQVESTSEETVCEIQQKDRKEPSAAGETSVTEYDVFFRAGVTFNTAAKLVVDGEQYEFTGDPWMVRNPRTGRNSHVQATAVKTGTTSEVQS